MIRKKSVPKQKQGHPGNNDQKKECTKTKTGAPWKQRSEKRVYQNKNRGTLETTIRKKSVPKQKQGHSGNNDQKNSVPKQKQETIYFSKVQHYQKTWEEVEKNSKVKKSNETIPWQKGLAIIMPSNQSYPIKRMKISTLQSILRQI